MMRALLALELAQRVGALRGALTRLRQPRYAIGAVASVAYLWFVLARPHLSPEARADADPLVWVGTFLRSDFPALALGAFLAWRWIFAPAGAPLALSHAEVAWLFPAPVAPRSLLLLHLVKTQMAAVSSALFFALIASSAGRPFAQRFFGVWLVFTFISLHGIAGSFTRERWRRRGLDPRRRAWVLGALFTAIGVISWRASGASELPAGSADGVGGEFAALLAAQPLTTLLAPLRWLTAPLRAPDAAALARALVPALGLLAVHFVWALAALVDFREATSAQAEKIATRQRALRAGGTIFSLRAPKVRAEPFALPPHGGPALAFLWQRLIAFGPWSYPRALLGVSIALSAGIVAADSVPALQRASQLAGLVAAAASAYVLLLAPTFARRSFAELFQHADLVKSLPLHGREVVWGTLVGPSALLAGFEVLAVTIAASSSLGLLGDSPALALGAWIGGVAFAVPLSALAFGSQLALQLTLPAWFAPATQRAGFEAGGLSLLFVVVPLLALLVTLVPAGLVAALAGYVAQATTGAWPPAIACAGIAGGSVVIAEVVLLVSWLGGRYERLDLARDLRS